MGVSALIDGRIILKIFDLQRKALISTHAALNSLVGNRSDIKMREKDKNWGWSRASGVSHFVISGRLKESRLNYGD